ncbi:MAG: c-type cytochrome [Pseudohongiellaceae bacterium]
MNRIKQLVAGLVVAATSMTVFAADRAGDFALIDHEGRFHQMAWYDDHEAVVILIQANGVEEVAAALADFNTLSRKYSDQGVAFFLLNPGLQTSREAVQAEAERLGIELPVLMDDSQLVSESLGASRIGEAIIYDPASFEVHFRGPVQAALEPALQEFLGEGTVSNGAVATDGPAIDFPVLASHEQSTPSYSRDVAPIIAENCAACHRADGIAPFALDSHMTTQGWSPMIREVVMTKRMPPGQVDNKVGRKVKDAMNLSDAEMQTLVHWINAGAPMNGDTDPLAELTWPDTKWQLGEPDMVVNIPPQTIPATGIVDYMNVPVDLELTEDRWVKASDIVAGDPTVLHHIITTVVPPGGLPDPQEVFMQILDNADPEVAQPIRQKMFAAAVAGEEVDFDAILEELGENVDLGPLLFGNIDPDIASISGYVPGAKPLVNPPGVGGVLKAGSTLNLQMHYTTTGKETTDASEIGIYFYPEGEVPEERMAGGVANSFNLAIPPQAKDHEMTVAVRVPQDAVIYSLMPHMHFRGKRMKFTAEYPDGSEELILSVPNYSFNWQLSHELEEPMRVPAGTRIVATGAFDNSSQNLFNPDPNSEVSWGEQSWEEMFMGFYDWKYEDQGGSE